MGKLGNGANWITEFHETRNGLHARNVCRAGGDEEGAARHWRFPRAALHSGEIRMAGRKL